MPSFIADGYGFWAGINPVARIHDGIEFQYRRLTPAETSEYIAEAGEAKGVDLRRIQADWILKRVSRWRMRKDETGKRPDMPKVTQALLVGDQGPPHIEVNLLSQIADIVIWGGAPDYIPDGEETEEEAVKN